jgi:hypothetical protein
MPVCWAITVEAGRQVVLDMLVVPPSKTEAALLDWNSSGKSCVVVVVVVVVIIICVVVCVCGVVI